MFSSKKFVALICISLVSFFAVGCSDDSNPVSTSTPVDTAPPAVPTNLSIDFGSGLVSIQWAANTTDADLAGYLVSREIQGAEEALVSTPALITTYVDENPASGFSTYHISAVDESGNESAVASINLFVDSTNRKIDDLEFILE